MDKRADLTVPTSGAFLAAGATENKVAWSVREFGDLGKKSGVERASEKV